eukprot:12933532-Prorocentrum_lima.AAC.1
MLITPDVVAAATAPVEAGAFPAFSVATESESRRDSWTSWSVTRIPHCEDACSGSQKLVLRFASRR